MTTAPAPTLAATLAAALTQAGHPAAFWAHICAIPRRNSGWVLLAAGHSVEATTVQGQPAAYVGYQGEPDAARPQLQAYAATLAEAGYAVRPICLQGPRRRVEWGWARPDPPAGVRALLVTAGEPPPA
jgi:hypothetical protein